MLEHLEELLLRGGARNDDQIRRSAAEIERALLAESDLVDGPNFEWITQRAIEFLFDAYDMTVFEGRIRSALKQCNSPITFRLSSRMTKAAGTTTQFRRRRKSSTASPKSYEIAISTTLLFQTFDDTSHESSRAVAGVACLNRVEALQRVMEHEMVHLLEMLVWNHSSCSASRFRQIASRCFGHRKSTHNLITPRERAERKYGIRAGDWVSFEFQGRALSGVVNRITKRATILVPDPLGQPYSDGRKYSKYYIGVSQLKRVDATGSRA